MIFVGYQLVTSLFLPNYATYEGTEEGTAVSRFVTVPYRAFALFVSLLVLFQNRKNKIKVSEPLKLFFIFWVLLIVRILYDLYVRTDIPISSGRARETVIYVFLTCLIPALSVYKSLPSINYEMAFKFTLFGYAILIPVFYINNPLLFSTESTDLRLEGNMAMNTIAFGHYGVTLALLALFWGKTENVHWKAFLSYFLIGLGVFVMLRAGSRGPLVALFACFVFYYMARQKTSIAGIVIGAILIFVLYLISDFIFDIIRRISPMLASRLTLSGTATEYEELSSGRSTLYEEALNRFYDSPLIGESFAIFSPDGSFIYSHNMVLDAFMGLGIIGGIIFVVILFHSFKNSYLMVMFRSQHWWIALVCIQYIVYYMLSGAFYQSGMLNALLIIALYYSKDSNAKQKLG